MKKILITILALALPLTTQAAFYTIPWQATGTSPTVLISPSTLNGNVSVPYAPIFVGSSLTQASYFPYATTTALTATSICFTADICRTTWPSSASSIGTISTSTIPTLGNLAYWTNIGYPSRLGSVATTTLSGSGLVSVTAGAVVIGSSPITVACATCGTGSVTSVTLATPNSTLTLGGTNPVTTSGTINADLNLTNSNAWTALQRFTNASTTQLTVQGPVYDNTNSAGTAAQVLTSNGANNAPTWQTAGGSGKTMDYYAATSSDNFVVGSGVSTYPLATTTSVQSGGSLLIWASCNIAGSASVQSLRLNVSNPGGGTTTVATGYWQGASGTHVQIPINGKYTATTTGKTTIMITDQANNTFNCGDPTIMYERFTN